MTSSEAEHLPRALPSNMITLLGRVSIHELERDTFSPDHPCRDQIS